MSAQRFDTLPDRYSAEELAPYVAGRLVLAQCERYLSDKAREKGAVNLGEDGEVEVEWARGRHRLTLYLGPKSEFMLDCGHQLPFGPELLPGLLAALQSFDDEIAAPPTDHPDPPSEQPMKT